MDVKCKIHRHSISTFSCADTHERFEGRMRNLNKPLNGILAEANHKYYCHWNSYPPCKRDIQKYALVLFYSFPFFGIFFQLLNIFKSLLDVLSFYWHNPTCTPSNMYSACQVRHKVIFDISFETSIVVTGWKTFYSTVVNVEGRENPPCDK